MSTQLIHSVTGNASVFLEMPHSGWKGYEALDAVPQVLASKLRLDSERVRKTIGFGIDAAVPHMSGYHELLASMGLSGLCNELARVFTDTNRGRDEVSGLAVAGRDDNKHNHGVIWARTIPAGVDPSLPTRQLEKIVRERCEPMLKTPLTEDEFNSLLGEIYEPYHALIRQHHERLLFLTGRCIHLALHSLPAVAVTTVDGGYVTGKRAQRGPFDLEKNTLPDVILIHNGFKAAGEKFVQAIRRAFESAGLIVEDGKGPFLGDKGVTQIYGNPDRGVHVIGIEHVAHDIEFERHLGDPVVHVTRAERFQAVYRKAVESVLAL